MKKNYNNISDDLLDFYRSFRPFVYNALIQSKKEQLVKDTIIQICKDKNLPEDIPVFFTYADNERGDFNYYPSPHINITMGEFTNPYELLETIIHEMRHYEQYVQNKDKNNEIMRGLIFPLDVPFYYFQKHEMDAYRYTFAELRAASAVNIGLKEHADKAEKDFNVKRKKVALQTLSPQGLLKIETPFARLSKMKEILKLENYLTFDMFGKKEHYHFNISCPGLDTSENHNYSVEYCGVSGKTIFSLTENDKHLDVIIQGNRADISFESNFPFNNFKEMISIAASFVNDYNKLNGTKITTLNVYPKIGKSDKLSEKILKSINDLEQTLDITRIPLNNKAIKLIKEEMGRQYLLLLMQHRINNGIVDFMATEDNVNTGKTSERVSDYLKDVLLKDTALVCKYSNGDFLSRFHTALMKTYRNYEFGFDVDNMAKEDIKDFLIKHGVVHEDRLDEIINANKNYNKKSEYYKSEITLEK